MTGGPGAGSTPGRAGGTASPGAVGGTRGAGAIVPRDRSARWPFTQLGRAGDREPAGTAATCPAGYGAVRAPCPASPGRVPARPRAAPAERLRATLSAPRAAVAPPAGRGCRLVQFSGRRAGHAVAQGPGQAVTSSSWMMTVSRTVSRTVSVSVRRGDRAPRSSAGFARTGAWHTISPCVVRGAGLEQDTPGSELAHCAACLQPALIPAVLLPVLRAV